MTAWLQTATGGQFYPLAPRPEYVKVEDIAHALANVCRFAGHSRSFYSVAQHSVLVSRLCEPQDALWGLLHDASEAYLGDVISPLKRTEAWAEYRKIETRVQGAICDRFGLPLDQPDSVGWADLVALATEKRDVMLPAPADWMALPAPDRREILPLAPEFAKRAFLYRYEELTRQP